jgi:hypothetical protein
MHAFSANDYVYIFFRKEKQAGWKAVNKNTAFIDLFSTLDTEVTASEELVRRPHILSVNEARKKVFWSKLNKEKKIIDHSTMPVKSSSSYYDS